MKSLAKGREVAVFLIFTLFMTIPVAASATEAIATFTRVKGEVRIKSEARKTRGKWLRVKKGGVRLFNKDEIRTLAGSAEITFNDGSIIKVNENSSLLIEEKPTTRSLFGFVKQSFTNRNIKIMFGSLWAKIRPVSGKWTSFESKSAVAGIKGTTISVSVKPDGTMQFSCDEGFVEIANPDASWTLKMDSGKEVRIKSLGDNKTLIKSVKGDVDILSGEATIDVEHKGAVILGETDGQETIEVPGDSEGPVFVNYPGQDPQQIDPGDPPVVVKPPVVEPPPPPPLPEEPTEPPLIEDPNASQ